MHVTAALGQFLLRTMGTAAGIAGGFLIKNELPITLQVIGGFTLIGIGAFIYLAASMPMSKTNTTSISKG